MFNRVLVANRGEIAVRVIRALHELGIEAVAIYSTADEGALHTRLADRAVCIGPPPPNESYLRIPSVIAAATTTRCDAIHPGYGFLSEKPAFADACLDNDVVFIGPSAETMTRMGDKAAAKQEMVAAGVPVVPGTEGATNLEEARDAAEEAGYPVLLKAVAGGGGKGMRTVRDPDELEGAFQTAAAEAQAAFGEPGLYLEKAIVPARHVEIQVLADGQGGVLTLGERECSIQRRHQKLIEESPSPALDDETREQMEAAAEKAARAVDYRNAGTFEFLLGTDRAFYFIELNARLQVEHPVSELVTGIDIVREQLRVAAGERLSATGRAAPAGACDRDSRQRRGSCAQLPADARQDRALPPAARPGRAGRHTHRGRRRDPAELRLAARQARGLGRRPSSRDRPRSAGAGRARGRGRADDGRGRTGHPAHRGVRRRQVLDELSRGGGEPLARAHRLMAGRRAARRTALFLLYQWDVTGQPLASLYEGEVDPFAQQLAEEVAGNAEELDRRVSEASEGWPADRLGRARAERSPDRNPRARSGRSPRRGGDRRSGHAGEAVLVRRGRAARERDPRAHREGAGGVSSAEESLKRAEELLGRLEQTRERLEAADDPDAAIDILAELAEIAKQVEAALEQARRDAGE